MEITEKFTNTHELVLIGRDNTIGYHGIIAIHSTALGPAVGGTRFWSYDSEDEALTDALRLSQGMTYKSALAGLPLGGGKSIIIGNSSARNRNALLRAHGSFVNTLQGRYITAEDVGTSPADMEIVRLETEYVGGLIGLSGDPSPHTALGVYRAIQASNYYVWRTIELSGLTVAIQGCGNVGYHLAKMLHETEARLIVTDVNNENLSRVVDEFGAEAVAPNEIFSVKADVFAPCALGGVLNDETIPQLKVLMIAGSANNQLLEERHGTMLRNRNILYAPDYVANAGGVMNGCTELLGWAPVQASQKILDIYDTVLRIFKIAEEEGITSNEAADRLAEERLKQSERPEDRD